MELPNVISAGRAWMALFRCHAHPVRPLVPQALEPVSLRGARGVVAVFLIDCEESTFGPYQQLGIGFAARHRPWLSLSLGTMWFERRAADFGYWIQFLATSTEEAHLAHQEHWGLPSIHTEVAVQLKRSKMRATVREDGVEVLRFEMKRPGPGMPLRFPLRHYSQLGAEVLRTEMNVDAVGRERSLLASSSLTLRRHERVETLRSLSIATNDPMEVRWYDAFRTRVGEASARYKAD